MLRAIGLLCLLLLVQCRASTGMSDDQEQDTDRIFLEMSRTRCFGSCPAYSIKLFLSGKVEYIGEHYVPYEGKKEFTLRAADLEEIKRELKQLNFFELEDRYYKDVTDLPTTYITVSEGDVTKKVMDYYGAPVKLKTFEDSIQKIIFTYLDE